MKKILSLALAAMIVSAGVMHAAKQNYAARKAVNVHMTRSMEANPLVKSIVAAESQLATNNGVRAELKAQINAELKVLLGGSNPLAAILAWCDELAAGVIEANGTQLIADILAVQPVLNEALLLLAAQTSNDALQSGVAEKLSDFKGALTSAKAKNKDVAKALAGRSELDAVFAESLGYLMNVLDMFGSKVAAIPVEDWRAETSSWDELGRLLNMDAKQ